MEGSVKDKLEDLTNNLLSSMEDDYELKQLVYKSGGKEGLIRVFIDKPDGINIDECAQISGELSTQLDVLNFVPEPYRLEVSSPGIENEEES